MSQPKSISEYREALKSAEAKIANLEAENGQLNLAATGTPIAGQELQTLPHWSPRTQVNPAAAATCAVASVRGRPRRGRCR